MNRLTPLSEKRIQQKREYFEHFRRTGFRDYRSPWVPITGDAMPAIKKLLDKEGGIVTTGFGVEVPVPEGRDITYGRSAQVRDTLRMELPGQPVDHPSFAWIDGRSHKTPALAGSMKEQYDRYSECVAKLLAFLDNNRHFITPVQFPLFHASRDAYDIQRSATFDYSDTAFMNMGEYGFPMLAARDKLDAWKIWHPITETEDRSAALIRLRSFRSDDPPFRLDMNPVQFEYSQPVIKLSQLLSGWHLKPEDPAGTPRYTWQMVMKEIFNGYKNVTTLEHHNMVCIYEPDPFCNYEPDGVVER